MATLPDVEISFGSELKTGYRFNTSQFGDGYSQRSVDGINTSPRSWNVLFNAITTAEADSLQSFFDINIGGVVPFDYTDPLTGETRNYTLEGDLDRRPIGGGREDVRAVFKESFDL